MTQLELAPVFDPAKAPYHLLRRAIEYRDDVDGLLTDLEFEEPDLTISREDARSLIRFATNELDADKIAGAPSNIDPLESKINKVLNDEIDRIGEDMAALRKIAAKSDDGTYRMGAFTICPEEARVMIDGYTKRLLDIKRTLNDQRKADKGGEPNQFNLQVNLGAVIDSTLKNMQSNQTVDALPIGGTIDL